MELQTQSTELYTEENRTIEEHVLHPITYESDEGVTSSVLLQTQDFKNVV
jgi:hypothetical protein